RVDQVGNIRLGRGGGLGLLDGHISIWNPCGMLTQFAWNEWCDGRINDSLRRGPFDGGRGGGGARSRSVWRRAAAKKGQQLLVRMVLRRTVTVKRLGSDEAGE